MLKNSQMKVINVYHKDGVNVHKHGLGGFIGQIYGGSGDIRGYGPGNLFFLKSSFWFVLVIKYNKKK